MLKSSYAELEAKANSGRIFVLIAMAVHLTASILSMAGLSGNPARFIVPLGIQLGLCYALFAGKNWSRWILFAFNIFGLAFLCWFMSAKPEAVNPFVLGRSILCIVVAVLLLLPATSAFIQFKSLRF